MVDVHGNSIAYDLANPEDELHLLNVYSDAQHTAITWLARNHARLPAVSYMAGDFNSHSAVWDDGVHRQHSPLLRPLN